MILNQNSKTGFWTETEVGSVMRNVHDPRACEGRGCAIHDHPSDHPLKNAPLNWRNDRGILERICEHGVGHPDYDSARYLDAIGDSISNVHGCDLCCLSQVQVETTDKVKKTLWRKIRELF